MPYSLIKNRITFVWLALLIATCLSWETGDNTLLELDHRVVSSIVLSIAFLKVRFVVLDFMELRHAPLSMRLLAEAWPLLIAIALIAYYWMTTPA